MRTRVHLALASAVCLVIFPGIRAFAGKKNAAEARQFTQAISKDQRIEQALNRLTFGARPGDAAQVQAMGLKVWIAQQLHPDRIAENPVLLEKLKTLDTLNMTGAQLVRDYPTPQMVKQMVAGDMPFPSDPDKRMMIEKLVKRFEKQEAQPSDVNQILTADQLRDLRRDAPEQRLTFFEALPREKQDDVMMAMPRMRLALFNSGSPELRRRIELLSGPQQVVYRDLAEAKVLRAIYSNRQLEEQLDDFWFNHFNVFVGKGADRYLVTDYEREAIRPHVLGKFRDLLEATAKSPAMLFYLDNWQSVGPNAPQPRGPANKQKRGLNENYGRELMELHTLGVDAGYTQKDVTEVARCFTGWTINQPQRGGQFVFNPRLHDNGEKVVLGVTIAAGGGEKDGERVLDILSRQPATARFISKKLAMRFVADEPPDALLDHMSDTFLKTDGDIRQVMLVMIDSKEFWSVGAYRTKMKSPLEMVASAVRSVNGNVDYATALMQQVAQLGEPLYRKLEPTGYSNSSKEWANSASLMARMNFALQLAGNKVPGVKVEVAEAAIPLGSPDFQKR